jgi:protein O-GlcNAc transferase
MNINKEIEAAFKYYKAGELRQAENVCLKILNIQPTHFNAISLLGAICYESGNYGSAVKYFKRALRINPTNPNTYFNLGLALNEPKTLDEAIFNFRKAIELKPDFADANYYLGTALKMQGRLDEAVKSFDMALNYDPQHIKAFWARCMSRLLIVYPDESSIHISRKHYEDELIKLREMLSDENPRDIQAVFEAVDNQKPFYLAYQGFNDRELQQIYGDLVCKVMSLKYPQFSDRPCMPPHLSEEPLRIGIVSGYFYDSSVWKIPMKGWIENIDKQRFNLYGYFTGSKNDDETNVARQCCTKFVSDVYSFEELCKIIRDDNLHVLIYPEIGMDPITLKLAAVRLAPVQCCSVLGHPQTSGFQTIDYYLSSDLMEPPNAKDNYNGQLIRLPNLSIYYTPADVLIEPVNRDTFNLRQGSTLYLCCQSLFKYLPQYDEVFPRIAKEVRDCQFLFIGHETNYITEQFRKRVKRSFDRFGLDSGEYIIFLPRLDSGHYRAINELSDVFLDSIGWSGCNTTFEAIACNLPVVTLPGELIRGRHAFGILTMMGLTETVAGSLDDYVSLAVRLRQDLEWRNQVSEKIAAYKHRLYNDSGCIAALEDFLETSVKENADIANKD